MESRLAMSNDDTRIPRPPTFTIADLKILIAEDENMLAWELEDLLRDFGGPEILLTASVKGVREILAVHDDISLVLLDLKLQDGSSEALIAELSERSIPLIIITGYSSYEGAGFPVLTKPYSAESLLHAIKTAIAFKSG